MTSPIWASRLPHSPHARPREEEGRNGGKTEGRKEEKRQWGECRVLMGLHEKIRSPIDSVSYTL